MTKNTKSTKNAAKASTAENMNVENGAAIETISEAEQKAEQAAIALHKAGMASLIDAMLMKAGLAISEAEHVAAKPMSEADKAKAALAAIGIDIAELKPETAKAGKLAIDKAGLVSAFGKYGKHVYAADTSNGTSIVTHSIAKQLIETGKATLAKTLDDARAYLPQYSSTGHFNTCKRLLKAEYALNIWQGGFSITSK